MLLTRFWLTDFRSYRSIDLTPAPGLTVLMGDNGAGKTNLLEAIGYLATLTSFRGTPRGALVRDDCERAVVRAELEREGRSVLIEAEISLVDRDRVLVNRQPLRRARDLLGALRVTIFSPDDLGLVKGGPSARRDYLDDLLVALHPRNDARRADLDRILRQRNALLRQAGGRASPDVVATLDVWDERLAEVGESLAAARSDLVVRLEPCLSKAYDQVADTAAEIGVSYRPSWGETSLAQALQAARGEELRRGVSLVGPHRDELTLVLAGRPARTHASQGEQRSLALALRLAAHAVVTDATVTPPVLLLDDVFSELDPLRAERLLVHLPPAQTLLTTTDALPSGARPDLVVRVRDGSLS
jgi:DNA replication and repair protein RecF